MMTPWALRKPVHNSDDSSPRASLEEQTLVAFAESPQTQLDASLVIHFLEPESSSPSCDHPAKEHQSSCLGFLHLGCALQYIHYCTIHPVYVACWPSKDGQLQTSAALVDRLATHGDPRAEGLTAVMPRNKPVATGVSEERVSAASP